MTSESPTAQIPPDPRPSRPLVAAVIVTHHPDAGIVDRIAALPNQVDAIVVVDNGSTEDELRPLLDLAGDRIASFVRNGENIGVASALNVGMDWARVNHYPWTLLLDQDTTPGPDVVVEAARVFDAVPSPQPAVISAGWASGWDVPEPGGPIACAITSGAIHSVAAWETLGGFEDRLFIDYVDTEFSLRARAHGYGVLGVRRPTIEHSIGHPTRHKTILRSFSVTNHDAMRRYYITRNRILVWRRYWRREPGFVASDITMAVKEFPKMILFEADRRRKAAAVVRGLFDGFRGSGKPPEGLPVPGAPQGRNDS